MRLTVVSKSAEVQKFLIVLVSLVVLTSSCAVKKVLWEELRIGSAVPAKSYPLKAISALCAEQKSDSLFDVAEVIPNTSVKAPLLLSLFVVVSAISVQDLQRPRPNVAHLDFFNTAKVPIYLKLGRLILYS